MVERYDHRSPDKMRSILSHPRMDRAGQTGPWGEPQNHPDRFEVLDSMQERVFEGRLEDALNFVKAL
jgi:hypothetical protein